MLVVTPAAMSTILAGGPTAGGGLAFLRPAPAAGGPAPLRLAPTRAAATARALPSLSSRQRSIHRMVMSSPAPPSLALPPRVEAALRGLPSACAWLGRAACAKTWRGLLAFKAALLTTYLPGLYRLPSGLFPHLLLTVPAALTALALLEWTYWRLAGDRRGRGHAPLRLLAGQYLFSVLPLLALALGRDGGGGGWLLLLRATAAWTLWQWPTLMEEADSEASPLLRFLVHRWRDALSLVAVLTVLMPLLGNDQGGVHRLLLPFASASSSTSAVVVLPALARTVLAWATLLHLALLFLPHMALLHVVTDPASASPLALNAHRPYRPLRQRLLRLLGSMASASTSSSSSAVGLSSSDRLALAALPPLLTPGVDPREKLRIVGLVLDAARPPRWRSAGDVWRRRLEELRRREEEEGRRRARQERELFDLRRAAALQAVARGMRGREREEERLRRLRRRQQQRGRVGFYEEEEGLGEAEEDEETSMFTDVLRQMTLVLGRRPRAEDMKWLDSVAPARNDAAAAERLIDDWVVRYWIQADATWAVRHPPSVLRRPFSRPLSLAEWREEELAAEVRRGRRRLGSGDRGGLAGWVEEQYLRWKWRDKVRRWEEEGRRLDADARVSASAALREEDMVGQEKEEDEEEEMGGLEDPRRLASLALEDEDEAEADWQVPSSGDGGADGEEEQEEGLGMWSVGQDAEGRLGFFDLGEQEEQEQEEEEEAAPGEGGDADDDEEEGDVPMRLKPSDLGLLKAFLEGKAAALQQQPESQLPEELGQSSSQPAEVAVSSSSALWGRSPSSSSLPRQEDEDEEGGDEDGAEEAYEYEYVYEDEVGEGEEFEYLGEEEERAVLEALAQRDQVAAAGGSDGAGNRNERFVVRGEDGRFYAPTTGRRLVPVGEEGWGEEEWEEGMQEQEEGPPPLMEMMAPLEAVPLRGAPGVVAGSAPHRGGVRLAATLRRAVRGRVLAKLARRVEEEHGEALRARGVPLEYVTFTLGRLLRDGLYAGGGAAAAPSFRLLATPGLLSGGRGGDEQAHDPLEAEVGDLEPTYQRLLAALDLSSSSSSSSSSPAPAPSARLGLLDHGARLAAAGTGTGSYLHHMRRQGRAFKKLLRDEDPASYRRLRAAKRGLERRLLWGPDDGEDGSGSGGIPSSSSSSSSDWGLLPSEKDVGLDGKEAQQQEAEYRPRLAVGRQGWRAEGEPHHVQEEGDEEDAEEEEEDLDDDDDADAASSSAAAAARGDDGSGSWLGRLATEVRVRWFLWQNRARYRLRGRDRDGGGRRYI